jgi:AcrR family transcriptional regulator
MSGIARKSEEDTVNARTRHLEDRRVQRTRRHLHAALMALIRESPYEALTVSDILTCADVGRSTFYMHFQNKDELLVSALREFLASASTAASASPTRDGAQTSFSLPLLEHIERHRHTTNDAPAQWAVVHDHLGAVVADMVANEINRNTGAQPRPHGALAPDLVGNHVASTLIVVLNWWLNGRSELLAGQVNELFQSLLPPAYA